MVDDEIDRRERVDLFRVAAEIEHGPPHRREIDDRRHTGQILHQDARRAEGDLAVGTLVAKPPANRLDIVDSDGTAAFAVNEVFQEDLQGYRQPRDIAEPRRLRRRVKTEIIVALAVDIEGAAGLQRVVTGDAHGQVSLERGALSAARQEAKLGGHDTPPPLPIKAAKWDLRYPLRRAPPRPPEAASNHPPRPCPPGRPRTAPTTA